MDIIPVKNLLCLRNLLLLIDNPVHLRPEADIFRNGEARDQIVFLVDHFYTIFTGNERGHMLKSIAVNLNPAFIIPDSAGQHLDQR